MSRIIAITGPESSGKSTLAENLLAAWGDTAVLIPEYARQYLTARGHGYSYSKKDVTEIARRQHEHITQGRVSGASIVICDTDYLVLHIWMIEVFGASFRELEKWMEEAAFHHVLLCRPDLAWIPDPLRENPNDRHRLFERYQSELNKMGTQYTIIEGQGDARIRKAADAIGVDLQLP
jgi:nicotinamide riboside kinase